MSRYTKNPLHPSALSINDLTIGRRVLIFNLDIGIVYEGVIVSRPYAVTDPMMTTFLPSKQLKVDIRSTTDGTITSHYLTSLGVIPYYKVAGRQGPTWSDVNFVVDHHKRHLLPAPTGMTSDLLERILRDMEIEQLIEEEEEEEGK